MIIKLQLKIDYEKNTQYNIFFLYILKNEYTKSSLDKK